MKLNLSKERCERLAELEGDSTVGAGFQQEPCSLSCEKCGSADIHRKFYGKDDIRDRSRKDRINERFFKVSNFLARAKRDCIAHHCRCCQWDWVTEPRPETPHRRMEVTLPNGTVASITGDPDMPLDTMRALMEMMRIVSEQAAAGTLHLPENVEPSYRDGEKE